MTIWLLIAAALFTYLAYDAWRLRVRSRSVPYASEAEIRGEPVAHVSLREQAQRQAWSQRYGVGDVGGIFWVWAILGIGCLAGALIGTYA